MGTRLSVTEPNALVVPSIISIDETIRIRVALYGVGAALTNAQLWVVDSDGIYHNITGSLRAIPIFSTFITCWEAQYTPAKIGHYTFFLLDTSTGDTFMDSTLATEWASNMDFPISGLKKVSTSVSQLRNYIRKGA